MTDTSGVGLPGPESTAWSMRRRSPRMASVAVMVELLSAAIGLAAGAGLGTLNYALAQRARLREELGSRLLAPCRAVFALAWR
jgi:hypothetical protein